jgi:hypothetical protein
MMEISDLHAKLLRYVEENDLDSFDQMLKSNKFPNNLLFEPGIYFMTFSKSNVT